MVDLKWSGYCAVRLTEGREWLEVCTASSLIGISRSLAQKSDTEAGPGWAKCNPVVRFARVEMTLTNKESEACCN